MHNYSNKRDPIDHQVDLETMCEMEEVLPMNLYERKSLHNWVYRGNDPEKIPGGTVTGMAGCWIMSAHTDAPRDMNIR